jgi:antitoxin VapB
MGIFIKNPAVERKARELAHRTGRSLTAAVEEALDRRLAETAQARRSLTLEELRDATDRFRRDIGLDKVEVKPMTKKDWDDLWPTGIPEIDEL